jgi:oxalate decarboxylase
MGAAMTVSAASAGSYGNLDEPPEGAINAKKQASVTDHSAFCRVIVNFPH